MLKDTSKKEKKNISLEIELCFNSIGTEMIFYRNLSNRTIRKYK